MNDQHRKESVDGNLLSTCKTQLLILFPILLRLINIKIFH